MKWELRKILSLPIGDEKRKEYSPKPKETAWVVLFLTPSPLSDPPIQNDVCIQDKLQSQSSSSTFSKTSTQAKIQYCWIQEGGWPTKRATGFVRRGGIILPTDGAEIHGKKSWEKGS